MKKWGYDFCACYLTAVGLVALMGALKFFEIEGIAIIAGYDWKTIFSCTQLSLKLLIVGIFFTFFIQTGAVALCFATVRFQEEVSQLLQVLFQIVSAVPLFVASLYLWNIGIKADVLWGGFVLAIGDFMLAELFPLLHVRMRTIFSASYREALRGRGISLPAPIFCRKRWKLFWRYYGAPYFQEFLQVLEAKVPLFFSAIIVIEKAFFYGANTEGANRGLGSLFFDCIVEWSDGKPRAGVILRLTIWCVFLVGSIKWGCRLLSFSDERGKK